MTPMEQALWASAQEDYVTALKIARLAWSAGPDGQAEDGVIQAATATVLIHVTKLRDKQFLVDARRELSELPAALRVPDPPLPTGPVIPPCPKCGGAMKVNAERRTDKSPNYLCTQEKGQCGKPSDDGKKWFPSGAWAK